MLTQEAVFFILPANQIGEQDFLKGLDKMFEQEYQDKLTTPEKAVLSIPDNALLSHGNLQAEPPALLKAIEDRLRSND